MITSLLLLIVTILGAIAMNTSQMREREPGTVKILTYVLWAVGGLTFLLFLISAYQLRDALDRIV